MSLLDYQQRGAEPLINLIFRRGADGAIVISTPHHLSAPPQEQQDHEEFFVKKKQNNEPEEEVHLVDILREALSIMNSSEALPDSVPDNNNNNVSSSHQDQDNE